MRYDLSKRVILYKVNVHKESSQIMAIAVSADEKYVAVSDWQKRVALLLASDGKFQIEMKGHPHVVRTLVFGSDGLVSGAEDGAVKLWNVESGSQKANRVLGIYYNRGDAVLVENPVVMDYTL